MLRVNTVCKKKQKKTYTVAGSIPGPRTKNGTRTSNSNGKLFPLINPN